MDDDSDQTSAFWLPSEFLTDDDFLPQNQHKLPKSSWVMSTSPQSTLVRSLGGSSNGSPPTTPSGAQNDDVMDLISRAAGQVASLSLSGDSRPTGLVGPRRVFSDDQNHSHFFLRNAHFQKQNVVGPRNRCRIGEMGQPAWTVKQNPTRFVAGSGMKSAGTGVFLPRVRNESRVCNGSDSRKKPSSFGLVPDGTTNHAFTKNYGNLTDGSVNQFRPRFDHRFSIQDYELLMAHREAMLLQQRRKLLLAERSSMISRDMYLPPDWTY